MSRLGKLPIAIPKGTTVLFAGDLLTVKGPKGTLTQVIPTEVKLAITEAEIVVTVIDADDKKHRSLWGLMRSLIRNMVEGVNKGFEKKLEINGVGYKMAGAGDKVNLSLGFSHPVIHQMPEGVTCATPLPTEILIKGIDKQRVGQVAAEVRAYRSPEPYKGKGVRYADEVVVIKETKKK